MTSRRNFVKTGVSLFTAHITGMLLPAPSSAATKAAEGLRVLFASDGHYGEPGTRYEDTHADIIRWIKEEHAANPIDFVIFNGDIVHDQPQLLATVRDKYFSQLPMPWYALPGNHDHAAPAIWKEVFGYDVNYSIDRGSIAFVLLNTSNEKGQYVCPDITFLKAELEKFKTRKQVFVVMHIPPHQWLKEEIYFTECAEAIDILHSYKNVKAVFHGHDHTLDGVRYTSGLPHFFDGHYGGSWGTSYYGFRVLEIDAAGKMLTYQRNPGLQPILNKQKI